MIDLTQESEVLELEKKWADAIKRRDASSAEKFLSEGYFLAIGVQNTPLLIVPRERWLAALETYVTDSWVVHDVRVHVYSNTAVVVMAGTQKATVRGEDRSGQLMITDIWVNHGEGWRVAERHSSRAEPEPNVRPK